jgi:hypothetical protein
VLLLILRVGLRRTLRIGKGVRSCGYGMGLGGRLMHSVVFG